jgi:hypothetical protein
MKAKVIPEIFVAILLSAMAGAQTLSSTPAKPTPEPVGAGANNFFYRAGLTCGAGASQSQVATKPTMQCGGMITFLPFLNLETGVMGPQANRSSPSGYLSTDAVFPLPAPSKRNLVSPLFVGGYTRMFETGHAVDYGFALEHPIDSSHSIQFEVRDYWAFANPNQHNVVFRVVWLVGVPD